MRKTSVKQISDWCRGVINPKMSDWIDGAVIDSRKECRHKLFFCLKGERSDGHNFISEARSKGAVIIGETEDCDITVGSSLIALNMIAANYRNTVSAKVVAVTGSSGKTTTKDILASIMREKFVTHVNEKSFNNDIGLPLTVLEIEESTELAILEMGANHKGEIRKLSELAHPDIGVITNIGDAHIGLFGSRQAIMEAKLEIIEGITPGGSLIYNFDQTDLKNAVIGIEKDIAIIGFGLDSEAEISAEVLHRDESRTIFQVEGYSFNINIPAIFNVYNCLAAISVAKTLGLQYSEMYESIKSFKRVPHRMELIKVSDIRILDDSYNSNPSSFKNLFDELLKIYGQTDIIAVIGDMLELGEFSERLHEEAGYYIAKKNNVSCIIVGGHYSENYIRGALDAGFPEEQILTFNDAKEAADKIRSVYEGDALVVLKASRKQNLEEIIDLLIG